MRKQYQNIGAQITNLEKNKHVDKATIPFACFHEKTYLDIVNPYSDLIALGRDGHNKHVYPPYVDFNQYLEFNRIDSAICNYLHVLIGAFEKMMKNFLMHAYCSKMKASGDKQTKDYSWTRRYARGSRVFDLLKLDEVFSHGQVTNASEDLIKKRKKVLSILAHSGSNQSKNNMVLHYQNKYGHVPMFVAIHSLSLGQLLTLFGMLCQKDKNELLCIFNGIDPASGKRYPDSEIEKFEKDILRIHVMRNIVNHYEPMFPFFLNTSLRTFPALTDLLEKLKVYYQRTQSFAPYAFSVTKTSRSNGSYSREHHIKIEKVIRALM